MQIKVSSDASPANYMTSSRGKTIPFASLVKQITKHYDKIILISAFTNQCPHNRWVKKKQP